MMIHQLSIVIQLGYSLELRVYLTTKTDNIYFLPVFRIILAFLFNPLHKDDSPIVPFLCSS